MREIKSMPWTKAPKKRKRHVREIPLERQIVNCVNYWIKEKIEFKNELIDCLVAIVEMK